MENTNVKKKKKNATPIGAVDACRRHAISIEESI
jgi:hypothetical protein